jgi:hypothetical protein
MFYIASIIYKTIIVKSKLSHAMKTMLKTFIALLICFATCCQNEIDNGEFNIPNAVEISIDYPASFATELNQEIKFINENDTIFAEVVELDINLCPSNPGIICISKGYLVTSFELSFKGEKDTVQLRYGEHPDPDYWEVLTDSATIIFGNIEYRIYLMEAKYYSDLHTDEDIEKKEGLFLTMNLKKFNVTNKLLLTI